MVDVNALDSVNLSLDKFREFLKKQEHIRLCRITSRRRDHLLITIGLSAENLKESPCLCLHLGESGISLTLCVHANLLSLSLCLDNLAFLLYLL